MSEHDMIPDRAGLLATYRRRLAEHRRLRLACAPSALLADQLAYAASARYLARRTDADWRFWPFRAKGAAR